MSDNKDVKRGIVLYIDGKEVVNNVTSIKAELRKLTKELDGMAIGSKEYVEQTKKIRALKQILNDHQQSLRGISNEVRQSTFSMGKFVDGFNRFGGFIASSVAALTGFILGLRALRDEQNKLEDSQHGLKALTGLDDNAISWLTDKAKVLSTTMTEEGLRVRQSANEILDAFMLVGSAKPELLGNKEALAAVTEEAMRLQAAAKDITLNQAVDALTLSLNQYGDASDQAARYANVLAAGSKAGAANIASQAKAIRTAGTAASSANVPIEKTVGLIETLAYKGIKDEIAGTGLKKFFLVLQTGAKELNPAIVGLDKALENLKNKKMDAGAIKKMFGEEGYNVASVILQNTDMVKQFTEAVTDTNIAYEQAAINSDTASAKLEQARNQMKLAGIELIEKLNPAIMFSTNAMTYVVRILPGVIDWFQKWGGEIVVISIVILLYITRIKLVTTYHTILNTVIKTATIIQGAYRLATIALNDALAGDARALAAFARQIVNTNALTKIITASTMLYRAAVELLTFRFSGATKALRGFWVVARTGGLGLLLTVATAVGVAWLTLSKRMDIATKAQQKLNDVKREAVSSVQSEITEVNSLYKIAADTNASYTARKDAIEALNRISPEYLGNLKLENINTSEAKTAIDEYVASMIRKATIMTELNRLGEINAKLAKYDNNAAEYLDKEVNAWEFLWNAFTTGSAIPEWEELLEEKRLLEESLKKGQEEEFNSTNPTRTLELVTKELENAQKVLDKLNNTNTELFSDGELISYNAQLRTVSATIAKLTKEKKDLEQTKTTNTPNTSNDTPKEELNKINVEYLKKQNDLKKRYMQDDKMTQQDYANELEKLELEKLDKQLTVAGLEPKMREEISNKILDAKVKLYEKIQELGKTNATNDENVLQSELDGIQESHDKKLSLMKYALEKEVITVQEYNDHKSKLEQETFEKRNKANEKAAQERLRKEERIYGKEVLELRRARIKENLTDEQYNKRLRGSRLKWLERMLSDLKLSEEDRLELQQEYNDLVIKGKEEEFEKIKESAEKYSELTKDIATEFGETIGEMIASGEFSMKEFLKETILMALDALERVIEICCIEVMARNMAATAPFSFIGAAKAAIQIAAIKAAFAVAKGFVGNFYTGGYTGDGNWNEPKGIVHSNEFIANRFAVANPAVRPVLDLIDNAQRTGSVSNLTGDDIMSVSGSGAQRHKETVLIPSQTRTDSEKSTELLNMLRILNQTMNAAKEAYESPSPAYCWAEGKGGINDAQNLIMKMKNNAKRK